MHETKAMPDLVAHGILLLIIRRCIRQVKLVHLGDGLDDLLLSVPHELVDAPPPRLPIIAVAHLHLPLDCLTIRIGVHRRRGENEGILIMDSILGNVQNALSSSERDTTNLTADLWPLPNTSDNRDGIDGIDPILIVCTDNGEPYALDPQTLATRGRLGDG